MRQAKLYHTERPKLLAEIERLGRERNAANARAQAALDAIAEQRAARDAAVAYAEELSHRLAQVLAEIEAAEEVEDIQTATETE
jgi:NAD-specific glutamate dehydrogenase